LLQLREKYPQPDLLLQVLQQNSSGAGGDEARGDDAEVRPLGWWGDLPELRALGAQVPAWDSRGWLGLCGRLSGTGDC